MGSTSPRTALRRESGERAAARLRARLLARTRGSDKNSSPGVARAPRQSGGARRAGGGGAAAPAAKRRDLS
eukprot:7780741-Alexandrium_andersonii.AAC.1